MNKRIKILRKELRLTQKEFAEKICVAPNSIARYELGDRNPSDAILNSICREFNVNEKWLRTGEGDMYDLPEDETAAIVSGLLEENNPFYGIILEITKTYQQLDDKSKIALHNFSKELLNNLKSKEED